MHQLDEHGASGSSASDWYARVLGELRADPSRTEADVSGSLIRPVLQKVLGFDEAEIQAEPFRTDGAGRRMRPDFLCMRKGSSVAAVIVEVKKIGVDLMRRQPGKGWSTAPAGQMQRYLNGIREADIGTWGIVTNGSDWILTPRSTVRTSPYEGLQQSQAVTLPAVRTLLQPVAERETPSADGDRPKVATDWLSQMVHCKSPTDFLRRIRPNCNQDTLVSSRGPAAFVRAGQGLDSAFVVCLDLPRPDGYLARDDIELELNTLHELPEGAAVMGVAYSDWRGGNRQCRGFVRWEGSLQVTALIDPALPGSRAARQFDALARYDGGPSLDAVLKVLSSVPLHRQFHEEIGAWFGKTRKDRRDLHHLIRVLFVWLLQDRGVLPEDALWFPGRLAQGNFAVHRHVEWLFSEVLAKPIEDREIESDDEWKRALVERVPFLNGSMFKKLPQDESPADLCNDMYLGQDGLLPILGRYDWTLSDRTGHASETAIDPAMLGELFEQLILRTEGIRFERGGMNLKMPDGTYYTPQDLSDEMAVDSIAAWLCGQMPDVVNMQDARALISPPPPPLPECMVGGSHETNRRTTVVRDSVRSLLRQRCIHRFHAAGAPAGLDAAGEVIRWRARRHHRTPAVCCGPASQRRAHYAPAVVNRNH